MKTKMNKTNVLIIVMAVVMLAQFGTYVYRLLIYGYLCLTIDFFNNKN